MVPCSLQYEEVSGIEEQLVVEEGQEYQSPYQSVVLHQTEVSCQFFMEQVFCSKNCLKAIRSFNKIVSLDKASQFFFLLVHLDMTYAIDVFQGTCS